MYTLPECSIHFLFHDKFFFIYHIPLRYDSEVKEISYTLLNSKMGHATRSDLISIATAFHHYLFLLYYVRYLFFDW